VNRFDEYTPLLQTAYDQVDALTRGNQEYLTWFRNTSRANRKALYYLGHGLVLQAIRLPKPSFEATMQIYVATHAYIYSLWLFRSNLDQPAVTFPFPLSIK
jgi:hypothetical protein